METLTQLTEREKIILQTQKDLYNEIYEKVNDIHYSKISPEYYLEEIEREILRISEKLTEPKVTPGKIEIVTPEYGPGDEVSHRIQDKAMIFKVMEIHHKTQEYKLTSSNQIKPITVMIGWGELDETL